MFLSKLVAKPPQLVPSMRDVFGTDKPNPFDFEGPSAAAKDSQLHERVASQVPKANSVWSKTGDLGIVERKSTPVDALSVPPTRAASTPPVLKENAVPQAPDTQFPDASHAVLIEGFMFPSHKNKLAKKVEKLLQKEESKDDIVVSDSDESSDMDSDASSASFALSDFEEDEVITLDELSLFSNLWRLFSTWITHETNLVVAGVPIPPAPQDNETDKPIDEAAARAARYRLQERTAAFSLMLNRPMPQVALKIKLAADRYINQKIADIAKTFSLRDAIDARNSHQVCVSDPSSAAQLVSRSPSVLLTLLFSSARSDAVDLCCSYPAAGRPW